ncbi:MAG: helix-turn-helix transcriptional regulator [Oscillibacter sp.]
MSELAKNLRRLRREKELTQDALAEKLHVTRQTISGWENDRTQPDIEALRALAAVFSTDVDRLITSPKEKNPAAKRGQVCACIAVLVVFALSELFLLPRLRNDAAETYHTLPHLLYWLIVPLLAALALGGLLAGLRPKALPPLGRMGALALLGVYLLAVGATLAGTISPHSPLGYLMGALLKYPILRLLFVPLGYLLAQPVRKKSESAPEETAL